MGHRRAVFWPLEVARRTDAMGGDGRLVGERRLHGGRAGDEATLRCWMASRADDGSECLISRTVLPVDGAAEHHVQPEDVEQG